MAKSTLYFSVFSGTTNTLLIKSTPVIKSKLEKLILKSRDHGSQSYYKLKNSLFKIPQVSPWHVAFGHFFARCAIFVRHQFFWASFLSISGGVFVISHFCRVLLFWNGIKECFFSWVQFSLGVFDGAVFVFCFFLFFC